MARIVVEKGEELVVAFTTDADKGIDVDGTVTVGFERSRIFVSADMPDSTGRVGTIYEERFGPEGVDARLTLPKAGELYVFHDDPTMVYEVLEVRPKDGELSVHLKNRCQQFNEQFWKGLKYFREFYSQILPDMS